MQSIQRIISSTLSFFNVVNRWVCIPRNFQQIRENTVGNKRKILYILHASGGGSEKHIYDVMRQLPKENFQCYIFKPRGFGFDLIEFTNGKERISYFFDIHYCWNKFTMNSESYKHLLRDILKNGKFDLIHVGHLLGHPWDVFDLAKEMQIPLIFSMNDYYTICPEIFFVDDCGNFCNFCKDANLCNACIRRSESKWNKIFYENINVEIWRAKCEACLQATQYIICPTASVKDILNNYYPSIINKCIIIEHGVDIPKSIYYAECMSSLTDKNEPLNIAYIGALIPHKGEKIFFDLVNIQFARPVRWFIIGFTTRLSKPGYYHDNNVFVTGSYGSYERLVEIVRKNNIHLAVFPALCPETYSFTLSECWSMGIPPIVSGIGALKERVENHKAGWVVPAITSDFRNQLNFLISKPEDIILMHEKIRQISLPRIEEMVQLYVDIYEKSVKSQMW